VPNHIVTLTDKKHDTLPGTPETCNKTPDSDLVANGSLMRAERTPGAVAVSEVCGERSAGESKTLADTSPTNALPLDSQTSTSIFRLVNFRKIRALLQPLHRYFEDKKAEITEFSVYDDAEATLCYPKIKSYHPDNPYRRYRLHSKASARTYRRIRQMVESQKWTDFVVADLTLTMPKGISEYLAEHGKNGRSMAWRLYSGFWNEDLPDIIGQDVALGCHSNLHLWSSKNPTQAQYHFHNLIANYGLIESKTDIDEDGEPVLEFVRWNWHRQRGGREVPFSDNQLELLKEKWLARLQRFCKRHGIKEIHGNIDIYVGFVDEWSKFLHKLNYNGRHWSEDYAEYSNENLDCPAPPEWLLNYDNKARVFGWWSNIKGFVIDKKEIEKISPYTGEQMDYRGKYSLWQLDDESEGQFGYVEFIKGQPVEGMLTDDDKEWLKGVIRKSDYEKLLDSLDLDTT